MSNIQTNEKKNAKEVYLFCEYSLIFMREREREREREGCMLMQSY